MADAVFGSNSAYNYVVTAQSSGAVSLVACGAFTRAHARDVIVAKGSKLEVFEAADAAAGDDDGGAGAAAGLRPLFEIPINGRIATMELVRVKVRRATVRERRRRAQRRASTPPLPFPRAFAAAGRGHVHAAADHRAAAVLRAGVRRGRARRAHGGQGRPPRA